MPRIDEVIAYLRPDAEWIMHNDSVKELTFLDDSVNPITPAEYSKGEKELIAKETADKAADAAAKAAILERLGITEAEAKLLLA
jgi:hypothetical protein